MMMMMMMMIILYSNLEILKISFPSLDSSGHVNARTFRNQWRY